MFEALCLCCTKIIYGKLTVFFALNHKYSLFFIWFKIFIYAVLLELLEAGFYKIYCIFKRLNACGFVYLVMWSQEFLRRMYS